MIFVDVACDESCYNPYESYGEICVGCNCCGRIDSSTMWECRLNLHKRLLKGRKEFDMWADDECLHRLQERNVKADIEYQKTKIAECKKHIVEENK